MLVESILNLAAHTGTVNRSEDSQSHKRVHQKKIGSARARLRAKYRANKPDACTASGTGLAVPLVTTLSKATIAEPNPASFSFPNNLFPPPAKPAALSCEGKSSKDLRNFKIQFWGSRPDCSFAPVWGGRSLLQIGGSVEQSVFHGFSPFTPFFHLLCSVCLQQAHGDSLRLQAVPWRESLSVQTRLIATTSRISACRDSASAGS